MNPTFVLCHLCACRRLQPCPQLPRTLRLRVTGGSVSLANRPISVLCPPPHFLCVTPLALAGRASTASRSLRNSPRFACDCCDLSACSLPYLCVYMSRGSPVCLLPSPRLCVVGRDQQAAVSWGNPWAHWCAVPHCNSPHRHPVVACVCRPSRHPGTNCYFLSEQEVSAVLLMVADSLLR